MKHFCHNNFENIYDFTEKFTKKGKGDLFEEFTYYLFKLDPRLNSNLKNIWMYDDVPEHILRDLKLPNRDKGIDLIAQIDDDYYAIQCKFRQDPTVTISWTELSTFFGLSFGMTKKIKGGFFVTNTYDLCDEVIESDKVIPIYGDFYKDLPANFFKAIRNKNITVQYDKKKPLPYQRKCIHNAYENYVVDGNNRSYIEMACGSGKTLTSYWIDRDLYYRRTVIFVPSLYLLSQFYTDWIKQSNSEGVTIKYLLIGSDIAVDKKTDYIANGMILCTSVPKIKKYIRDNTDNKLVVICTYQSVDKLMEACNSKKIFDFAIFDEAHKTVRQKGKNFSLALSNENLNIGDRLFMTATPKIYAGNLDKQDILSMNNEDIYGKNIFRYSTAEAIRDGRLVDYQVISMYIKNDDVHKIINNKKYIKYKDAFQDIGADYIATILLILKKIHDGTCNHMLTYHNTIKKAKEFSNMLTIINNLLYDKIYVAHLSGKSSMTTRNKIMREFVDNPISIMCSSKVLNEGINIPIVDSVCLVDPKFSTIDITQCIGRSLRLCEGKKMAYVIVPICIENFNDDFDRDIFGNIIRILKSLKLTDERIIEYFKMQESGNKNKGKNHNIVINEYYDEKKYSKEINLDKWNIKIKDKIWQISDNFYFTYKKVYMWVINNNKLPTGEDKDKNIRIMGTWCQKQRTNYKLKTLSERKIKFLEKMPLWNWGMDDLFNIKCKLLIDFVNINNKMPCTTSKNVTERKLGHWIHFQRKKFFAKKLKPDKLNALKKIKGWESLKLRGNVYKDLVDWVYKNNKIPKRISNDLVEENLGRHCQKIKIIYKNQCLTQEKIEKYENIPGWCWEIKFRKTFEERYEELNNWLKTNNNFPKSRSKNSVEKSLANWCCTMRAKKKNAKLTKNQVIKLNKIKGWKWDFLNQKKYAGSKTNKKMNLKIIDTLLWYKYYY